MEGIMIHEINKMPWLKKRYGINDFIIRKELQNALAEIKTRLSTVQCDFDLYLRKTAAELLLGMPEEAIESAKSALVIKESSFNAWYLLGNSYLDAGKVHSAKVVYEIALKLSLDYSKDILGDLRILHDIYQSLELIAIAENNEEVS
jgi:tetratricopeptide (TPR) repeat protein